MQMPLNAGSGTSPIVIAIDLAPGGGRTPSSDLQCIEDMDREGGTLRWRWYGLMSMHDIWMQPWIRRPVDTTLLVYRPLSELILGHENMNIAGDATSKPETLLFLFLFHFLLCWGLYKDIVRIAGN